MSWGTTVRITIPREKEEQQVVELGEVTAGDLPNLFVGSDFQRYSFLEYLPHNRALTLTERLKWREEVESNPEKFFFGIFVVDSQGSRTIIGHVGLKLVQRTVSGFGKAWSEIAILKAWQHKGIGTAAYRALLHYAFYVLNVTRVSAGAFVDNLGSIALHKRCGFEHWYTDLHAGFSSGASRDLAFLICLNPSDEHWSRWWEGREIPSSAHTARERCLQSLKWAQSNVTLL